MTKPKIKDGITFTREIQLTIGKRINEIRVELGMSQTVFARPLGISNSTLSQIETGNTNPNISLLYLLSNVYDVSLEYIINGEGEKFRTRFPEGRKIKVVDSFDDVLWLAENSPLFRSMVVAQAAKIYLDDEQSIKKSIELYRRQKAGEESS